MTQDHQEKALIQVLQDILKALFIEKTQIQRVLMLKYKLLNQEQIMQKQIVNFITVKYHKEQRDIQKIFKALWIK